MMQRYEPGEFGEMFRRPEGRWVLFTDAEAHAREREKAARRKALEDAARVADKCERQNAKDMPDRYTWGLVSASQAIAASIRAMMEEPDDPQ